MDAPAFFSVNLLFVGLQDGEDQVGHIHAVIVLDHMIFQRHADALGASLRSAVSFVDYPCTACFSASVLSVCSHGRSMSVLPIWP